jgi:hypothetical protein
VSRASRLIIVLASAFAWTDSVEAQDSPAQASLLNKGLLGPGVEAKIFSKDWLVMRPELQEELGLTATQIAKLKSAIDDGHEAAKARGQERMLMRIELQKRGDAEALAALKKNDLARIYMLTSESEAPLLKILDPRQRSRLEQLQLQADGPMALRRPEIQRRLNMTPGQIEMIEEIVSEGREAMSQAATVPKGLLPGGPNFGAEDRKKLLESEKFRSTVQEKRAAVIRVRQAMSTRFEKQLTKKQRASFQKMLGDPFDFAKAWPSPASSAPTPKAETKSP